MYGPILALFEGQSSLVVERHEGVAFFKAAKDLYRLNEVTYVCANLCVSAHQKHFAHCFYSDTCIKQFASKAPLRLPSMPTSVPKQTDIRSEGSFDLILPLAQRCDETAIFTITLHANPSDWCTQRPILLRECRILANYFHGHVLRITGYDSERELLISARELDCLKWTAAGKTAWEASVILGISERTVRFHLNAAREKLKCTNTTQAVAKAVANQLIDLS
jgi:DNA-binding CsgD family transcriptional regulator